MFHAARPGYSGLIFKSIIAVCIVVVGIIILALVNYGLNSGRHLPPGRMILSTISPPKSFNPVMARETSTTDITDRMFIGLTRTDGHSGEIKPHLAASWKNARQGRDWIFTLREGLKWSDGEPLTAHDVKFSYRRLYLNPDLPVSARDVLLVDGRPPEIEVLSDTRIKFSYHRPYAPFARAVTGGIVPAHILEPLLEAGKFESAWGVGTDPEDIVVNGPFRLKEYNRGQRIILRRNPHYYEKDESGKSLPRLEELQYEIVQNQDAQVQLFRRGELDIISLAPRYYPLLSPRAKRGDFRIETVGPATGSTFLSFNMNTDTNPETGEYYFNQVKASWFNDPDFRRAVSFAINREQMVDITMNGLGAPLCGPLSPTRGKFFNPALKPLVYNLSRAKDILKKAGYRDYNSDGYIQDPKGNTIKFVITTNAGNDQRVQMGQLIRKDLSRLGFKVGFNQVDFNTLVNQLSHTYDWEAMVMGFTGSLDPHFGSNLWLSSGSLHIWHPRQRVPQRSWEKDIDAIFKKAVSETDPVRRRQFYHRWQEIVRKYQPLIYLANSEVSYAIRDRLSGVEPTPIGGITHNIEKIGIGEKQ